MNERPLVSVLVLNYQGESHLEDCLASLNRQTYDPLEVVVADNGSSDQSEAIVRRFDARWEPLEANHGFALGNNLGVDRCKGEIVVFVNNDMRFDERFVEEIVGPLHDRTDPPTFAVDARQLSWAGDRVEHGATRLVRAPWRAVALRRSSLPGLDLVQDTDSGTTETIAACGSGMAVRKEMFDELGGFDARLPAGWEDIEICWRAALRGWSSRYVPDAIAWHKVGASSATGDGARIRLRGALGGRLLFVTKHLPVERAIAGWLLALAGLIGTMVRGRPDQTRARLSTIAQMARATPRLVAERRDLYRLAGTNPRHFLRRQLRVHRREQQQMVFVLGRRDEPTDGVEDYCTKLRGPLREREVEATLFRVPWAERGTLQGILIAYRTARRTSGAVNVQFTELSWSRRGVPLRALLIAVAMRLAGAEIWVTIHDPTPFPGRGLPGWARVRIQEATMTALTVLARRAFITVDPNGAAWSRRGLCRDRLTLLPAGTNIEPTVAPSRSPEDPFTVAVFSITEGPKLSEVAEIAEVVNRAAAEVGEIRLSVFGRGAEQAEPALRAALDSTRVSLDIAGVLDETEVSRRLANADVLLFLRGQLSSRRATVTSALAHALPVVGYRGSETASPITEAGVALVRAADTIAATAALVEIAREPNLHAELSRRSVVAHATYFSWPVLADELSRRRGS